MIDFKDDKHKRVPLFPLEVLDDIVKSEPVSGWSQWLAFHDLNDILIYSEAVLFYGANKYQRNSWKSVDSDRYKRAFIRHSIAMTKEENDNESGMPHEWHMITNAVFLAWFDLGRMEKRSETEKLVDKYNSYKTYA